MACLLSIFGSIVLIKLIYDFSRWLTKFLILYWRQRDYDPKIYGKWAVVTGATSGIGYGMAEKLAKLGSNVVIIGRKTDVLENMKKEFEMKYKVEIKQIVKDFSDNDYNNIVAGLEGLEIGLLVNNVGIASPFGQSLVEIDPTKLETVLNTNILSCVTMTRLVLPGMIQRKKGIVVSIGSASAYGHLPYSGIYPSSKKFIDFFNECMIQEYPFSKYGIYFHCIHPAYVATKLSKMKPMFGIPTAESYAESAISTFEYSGTSNGCLIHFIMVSLVSLIPTVIFDKAVSYFCQNQRKRYLKYSKKE